MKRFKHRLQCLYLCMLLPVFLIGCKKQDPVAALELFSGQCGFNFTSGIILSAEDTYRRYDKDRYTLIRVHYTDTDIEQKVTDSVDWKPLPLAESLNTFVYQPVDARLEIPVISNGYYFFEDRHEEAVDPSDEAPLLDRLPYNFTFAIYDTDEDILYFCRYDN